MANKEIPTEMILTDYILSKLDEPFQYGVNDCMLFSIGWIEIRTGKKYLPENLWTNEKEAIDMTEKNGGLIAVFDKTFKRIEPNYAQDGDLTVCDGVASLFSGASIVSVSKTGLVNKSRLDAKNAWTI